MGNLTKNISRHEVACRCGCGFDSMDWETINAVQECCDHFADQLGVRRVRLHITSAARCYKYNRAVGGADKSQHRLARAIDFIIDSVLPNEIQEYLSAQYPDKYGIGCYPRFTHFDTRSGPAVRW